MLYGVTVRRYRILSLVFLQIDFFSCDFEGCFRHDNHKDNKGEKVDRKYFETDKIAEKAEERGDKRRADIGACHLNPDNRARIFRAEVIRRRMNNARIDGRTTQSDNDKTGKRKDRAFDGKQQRKNPTR